MTPPTLTIKPPALHDAQRAVIASSAREVVLICGRRWGKTRLGVVKALFGNPHHKGALASGKIWWVAPTYAVSGIAWRLAKSLARKLPLVEIREADRALICPGGGELWFKSADRPENLRGEGLDGLIVDEADFIEGSKGAADGPIYNEVLRPALMDKRGWSLLISTPNVEFGWLHRLFNDASAGKRDGAVAFHYTSYDNPFLPREELDALKASSPELAFRREILAEFVGAQGALVKREWIKVGEPPSDLSVYVGVDLAISEKADADYTAIVVVGRDIANKRWWVLDAYRFRAPFATILSTIEAYAKMHQAIAVGVEDVQAQAWVVQELRRNTSLSVRGVKADKDKVKRFEPVAGRYEQGLIWHTPRVPLEFTAEITAFPDSLHDDFADALAYAIRLSGESSATVLNYNWVETL